MDQGISFCELIENLSTKTDKIMLCSIYLDDENVNTNAQSFNDIAVLKKYLKEEIPSSSVNEETATITYSNNTLQITTKTDYDSGFKTRPRNSEITIFNLKLVYVNHIVNFINDEILYHDFNNDELAENELKMNNQLTEALLENNFEKFKCAVENGATNYNNFISDGSLLSNYEFVKYLLELDIIDKELFPEMFYEAIKEDREKIVKLLTSKQIELENALYISINNDDFNTAIKFLKMDLTLVNSGLIYSAKIGNEPMVEFFIENGATQIEQSLNIAIENNHINIIKYLLKLGAYSQNSLYYAFKSKNEKIIELVLPYLTDLELLNHIEKLVEIIETEQFIEILSRILSENKIKQNKLDSLLYTAITNYHKNTAELLLQHGAKGDENCIKAAKRRNYYNLVKMMDR